MHSTETKERIGALAYSEKRERLMCSGPMRLNLSPLFNKYLEWGFVDDSLRFYRTENNKVRTGVVLPIRNF